MDLITSRRSIRHFTGQTITDDQVNSILTAAMAAPSAGNEQPWEFIIIRNRDTFNSIKEVHPYASALDEAPIAILVCGNMQREKFTGFWVQDCSAATQSILLKAVEMGMGAVWLGVYPLQERVSALQNILHLPEHILPLALIPIGYPAESKDAINRFDTTRIHYECWEDHK